MMHMPFRFALKRTSVLLAVLLAMLACNKLLAQAGEADNPEPVETGRVLGELSFPTMAESAEAQAAFIEGMLLLHLFEYPLAREEFQRAWALEPGFAMAAWGEAMTHNHPLWNSQDRTAGRLALLQLGDTPLARQDSTPAAREKLLIDAVETLYGDGPKAQRDRAYLRKMEGLAARFPEDLEVQLFYALAVLGVSNGVRDVDSYMLAAAISQGVFSENPQHPGAAHYLIHGVDDPTHAVLGLRAARALAVMAPDAAHAQHMTSHIFNALGMWDDVVIANEASVRVRNAVRAEKGEGPSSTGHANAWLIYGYLEQGRWEAARTLLDAAYQEAQAYDGPQPDRLALDPDRSVVGSAVQMWLRYLVETGDWDSEVLDWTFRMGDAIDPNLNYNFAQAMRSAHASLPSQAQQQMAQFLRLKEELSATIRRQEEPAPVDLLYLERLDVMEQQLLAMIEAARGEYTRAVAFAGEASRLEGDMPRSYGPPFVDMPSAQLLGDLYAASGNDEAAATAYALELKRNRQRAPALLGLFKAQQAAGMESEATYNRQKLALIWHLADPEVREKLE